MSDTRPIAIGGPAVKVRVSEHDIAWGARDDSSRCMVARALARAVEDASRIEVDTQTIRFTNSKGRFAYLTPLRVQQYVAAFDAGEHIAPFEFTIRNPMRLRRNLATPEERAEQRVRTITEAPDDDATKAPLRSTRKASSRAGERRWTPVSEGHRPPPRVFKTKKRTYGARVLRINQPREEEQVSA